MNIPSGEATIKEIAALTDTVMLSFSGGKDAIAAWLRLKPYFKKIVPYYMFTVPNLAFIETGLRYYEDFFNTKIYRVPQPGLNARINTFTYASPEFKNFLIKYDILMPEFSRDDIRDMLAEFLGLKEQAYWTATGVSAHDNIARRMMAHKHGAINRKRKVFYPLIDYKKLDVVAALHDAKIKLPYEYTFLGRSFDGIAFEYIYGVRQEFPEDYKKLLEVYPMLEVEFKRFEFREKRK